MADLVREQPPPTHNDHPAVWDLVITDIDGLGADGPVIAVMKDMRERDRVGYERYGTRLQPHNGRDNLVDAYQEALDLCVYLRTALFEGHDPELEKTYKTALHNTLAIRSLIWNRDHA